MLYIQRGVIMVEKNNKDYRKTASLQGLIILIIVGLLLFLILPKFQGLGELLPGEKILEGVKENKIIYKIAWIITDFSEGPFYAGILAGIGAIAGAFIAWRLDVKNSKYAGFRISYGLNIWPWVFASQILIEFISVFILDSLHFIRVEGHSWVATFLLLVGAAQATMVIYGPSFKALITGSILGSLTMVPIANWINIYIMGPLGMPGTIANYFALTIGITVTLQTCHLLPWMEKKPHKLLREPKKLTEEDKDKILKDPIWLMRRTIADLCEPLFYGNEIVSIFIILGAMIDWALGEGNSVFPAILFAQLLAGGISVYLYGRNHLDRGWYPTYIAVVSIAPFAVLTFGASLPVILFASILGGIIGPPFADLLGRNLPEHFHGVIPNVLAMGLTTMFVMAIMNAIPWF